MMGKVYNKFYNKKKNGTSLINTDKPINNHRDETGKE